MPPEAQAESAQPSTMAVSSRVFTSREPRAGYAARSAWKLRKSIMRCVIAWRARCQETNILSGNTRRPVRNSFISILHHASEVWRAGSLQEWWLYP
jgi:hypothetical protein